MLQDAWHGMLDRSLDKSIENRISDEANAEPDVRGVVSLKTRAIGQHLAVDMKLGVSPEMTLREGHAIANRVKEKLVEKIDNLGMVNVSPTAENADSND